MRSGWIWAFLAQFTVAATAASSSPTADSDSLAILPTCAIDCLNSSTKTSSCTLSTTDCLCHDADFVQQLTDCVGVSCTLLQALSTKNATDTICHVPERHSNLVYRVAIILGSVTGLFVFARFGTRIYLGLQLGYDDWFTLATGLVGAVATVIDCVYLKRNGLGRDLWTLTPAEINHFGIGIYIQQILYFILVAMVKLMFLFFYLQIFPAASTRYLLWGSLVVNCLVGTGYTLAAVFQCLPISFTWTRLSGLGDGHCLNISGMTRSNAIITIIMDTWIIAIPLWEIRNLNLTPRKKIGVIVMLCLGTSVTIFSILRLKVLFQFPENTLNASWEFATITLWSVLEINVGIIGACLPAIRILMVQTISWMQESRASKNSSGLKYADQRPTGRSRTKGTNDYESYGAGHFSLSEVSAFSKKKGVASQENSMYPTDEEGLVPKGIMVTRGVEVRNLENFENSDSVE